MVGGWVRLVPKYISSLVRYVFEIHNQSVSTYLKEGLVRQVGLTHQPGFFLSGWDSEIFVAL